ncbi:MAG: hypothetical protein A4S09_14015 [Proteobacteria bacterium SG_bin7]|nr:MAG: hypothetical protein A4S09_14015 [Proteobacteria bacterium SG_bin7]
MELDSAKINSEKTSGEKLSVFSFSNYKKFLQARLKDSWGFVTKVAEAAGCQRAYLSRVISENESIHLTPDHAYGISKYLSMSPNETEYFMALVDYARASSKTYRDFIEKKLISLSCDHENLKRQKGRERLTTSEAQAQYYSSWHWSAIHVLVSIPQFQNADSIAAKLNLPTSLVYGCLQDLAKNGFVRYDNSRWVHASGNLHLPKDSPFITYHHNNWRTRAVQDAQVRNNENVHLTIVQAMSKKSVEQIRRLIYDFVNESSRISSSSQSEEIMCTNLDFFSV